MAAATGGKRSLMPNGMMSGLTGLSAKKEVLGGLKFFDGVEAWRHVIGWIFLGDVP